MTIEQLVQNVATWNCGVKNVQELSSNICFYTFAEDRVEPEDLSLS